MFCFSCVTGFWFSARGEVSGVVDGRATTKEEIGLMMTQIQSKEGQE
jgi:hypothetical protein